MESIYQKENKRLIFQMSEDIDECIAQKMRRKLDNEIEKYMPKEVIFDFNKVSFMDSAGIGLIIGRYKLANMLGGKVQVSNLTMPVRKIFEMSGLLKIIPECNSENLVLHQQEPSPMQKEPSPLLQDLSHSLQKAAKRTVPDATRTVPFDAIPFDAKEVKYE